MTVILRDWNLQRPARTRHARFLGLITFAIGEDSSG